MKFEKVRFITDAGPFRRNDVFDVVNIDYSTGRLVASRQNSSLEHIFPQGLLEDPTYTLFICESIS